MAIPITNPPERRRRAANLLLSVGSLLGALVLGEALLRALDLYAPAAMFLLPPRVHERDRQTNWDVTYATSSLGLRGGERSLSRLPGSDLRVVVIGDSFTFGQGVPEESCYPAVLERRMREGGTAAEVINAGAIGIGPEAYYLLLRDIGLRFRPDVVVVSVFGNDASSALRSSRPRRALRSASHSLRLVSMLRVLRQNVAAADTAEAVAKPDLFWERLGDACATHRPAGSCDEIIRGFRDAHGSAINNLAASCLADPDEVRRWAYTDVGSEAWGDLADYLAAMRDLCRRSGTRLVVGIVPDGVEVDPRQIELRRTLGVEYPDDVLRSDTPFHRSVRDLCRRLEIPCYDPVDAFRSAPDGLYFEADLHWTAEGHRRYALGLGDFLERERISSP